MKARMSVVCFGLITLFGANIAHAQEAGRFYASPVYIYLSTDVKEGLGEIILGETIEFQAAGLRGGYEFANGFAVEFEANQGISNKDITGTLPIANTTADFSGTIDVSSLYGAFAVYSYPLTPDDKLRAFGRAGLMYGELEASGDATGTVLGIPTTISGTYSEEESGPVISLGLSYDLTNSVFIRTDVTYIGLDSFPTTALGASFGVKF